MTYLSECYQHNCWKNTVYRVLEEHQVFEDIRRYYKGCIKDKECNMDRYRNETLNNHPVIQ